MRSSDPIGGFFELELPPNGRFPQDHGLLLNSGRACLEVLLRERQPDAIHIPRYTCRAVVEAVRRSGVPMRLYAIDERLEIADLLPASGEMVLYTNYFGIKDAYCRELSCKLGDRLVLDCAQALYFAAPEGITAFYSPRKFVGVPDGGILTGAPGKNREWVTSRSLNRARHLLKRMEDGPEEAYSDFQDNERAIELEPPARMSPLTHRLLTSIDYARISKIRWQNFILLHEALGKDNQLPVPESFSCPMVYPYLQVDDGARARLLEHRIFVARYWPDLPAEVGDLERHISSRLLPLPVDQRYGRAEMERIVALLRC